MSRPEATSKMPMKFDAPRVPRTGNIQERKGEWASSGLIPSASNAKNLNDPDQGEEEHEAELGDPHPGVLALPAAEGLLADAELAAERRRRRAALDLAQG